MANFPATQVFQPAFLTLPGVVTFASFALLVVASLANPPHALGALWFDTRASFAFAVLLGIAIRLTDDRRIEGWLLAAMGLILVAGTILSSGLGVDDHTMPTTRSIAGALMAVLVIEGGVARLSPSRD